MNHVLPPGESPHDPTLKEIDAIAFALNKVRTYLLWIDEHRACFETKSMSDLEEANRELGYLSHSTAEAWQYLNRLAELLLSGYSIDSNKLLPRDLQRFKESLGITNTVS